MRAIFAFAALVVAAPTAAAQVCTGGNPFSNGQMQVGADIATTDGATSYGGSLSVGVPQGVFGSGRIGSVDFDDLNESATDFGLTFGYAADLGTSRRVQVCPLVSANYTTFPEITDGTATADFSGRTFGIGASLGFVAAQTNAVGVVPSIGVGVASQRVSVTATDGFGGSFEDSYSETYGQVTAGVGFILSRVASLAPFVSIPIGLEGADASFGVSLSFSFGGAGR